MPKIAEFSETENLDEISELYNQYRLGLMLSPPDLTGVTVPSVFSDRIDDDVKTANDSVSLSTLMTSLAYWPGLQLGLDSAEGSSSEDATHSQPHIGEIHHVTPYGA